MPTLDGAYSRLDKYRSSGSPSPPQSELDSDTMLDDAFKLCSLYQNTDTGLDNDSMDVMFDVALSQPPAAPCGSYIQNIMEKLHSIARTTAPSTVGRVRTSTHQNSWLRNQFKALASIKSTVTSKNPTHASSNSDSGV